MSTTSTDNNNDKNFEIPLELNDKLKSKGIIQKFVKNKRHKYITIELNNKYEQSIVVVSTINVKNWGKFHKSVEEALNYKGVYDKEDIRLIQNAIDDNHERILEINDDDDDNDYNNKKEGEKGEQKSKREFVTFKYSQMGKGELHEAVIMNVSLPFFIQYDHESKEFKQIENIPENSRVIRPPEREEYPYVPYEFSSLEEINNYKDFILSNNIDIDYLFQKSKSFISKYNNQDDYKLNLVAADVVLSYFQDRFSTIHYDYIVGGNGSGKSSLGDTFGAIAYGAVNMTDPTAPNLFRLLGPVEPAQCTIILEEADRIEKSQELMAILKTGYSRNGRVPKINPNTLKQEFFFSFCHKVIISERSLGQSMLGE